MTNSTKKDSHFKLLVCNDQGEGGDIMQTSQFIDVGHFKANNNR